MRLAKSKRQTPRSRRGKSQAVEALGLRYLRRHPISIAYLHRRIGNPNPGFGRELGGGFQYPGRVGGPEDHWALAIGAELKPWRGETFIHRTDKLQLRPVWTERRGQRQGGGAFTVQHRQGR